MGITVTLPHDPLWLPLYWAKANCPSYITNTAHEDKQHTVSTLKTGTVMETWFTTTKIDYHFGDSRDATLFALRWL